MYRRGSAKLRLSESVLAAADSADTSAVAAAAATGANTAAGVRKKVFIDPSRTLQSFDCGDLLTADLLGQTAATPEQQRGKLAASLQFGVAALAAADSSKSPVGGGDVGREADPLALLDMRPILVKAFSADADLPLDAGEATAAAPAVAAATGNMMDASNPCPPAVSPLFSVTEADLAAEEEGLPMPEDSQETPGDSIYFFEQQDFTPFVRGDRRRHDDAAALEALAAAAAASADDASVGGKGLAEEVGYGSFLRACRSFAFLLSKCAYSPVEYLRAGDQATARRDSGVPNVAAKGTSFFLFTIFRLGRLRYRLVYRAAAAVSLLVLFKCCCCL